MAGSCVTTRTTCPYCGVGCGVLASRFEDGTVTVKGDPDHPANLGRLCSKGSALAETLSLEDRLLFPSVGGKRASWDEALHAVSEGFARTIADHGPDSVALYVSGQILTEDYYVANKLMKGFIGSANIDTNSRLCMASSVAGHRRAFGSDTVPGTYEDLELADLIVLVGSNLAWCHPVLFQRIEAARRTRPNLRLVVVDPRRTATCELADLHLKLKPDTDVALFNGLLAFLHESGGLNDRYVNLHTSGLAQALEAAGSCDIRAIAEATGLAPQDVATFYSMVARTPKTVTVYSQGVNQSVCGTDKVNAILNTHLATGRIGRPGSGPFSVTGQPNAMGGREVGGLANMLAAHMDLENPDHRALVQSFWQSPRMAERPGLKAVDMFRAVRDGRIKAIWIMGTNPVDSLPDADGVAEALRACPLVVVSDVSTAVDTLAFAHVRLPAAAWGEKDGMVTNSERRMSRQKGFLPLPGEARADWWALAQVATRLGFGEAFAWQGSSDIIAEFARLSMERNQGSRDFDIGALAQITPEAFDGLAPFQWPWPAGTPAGESRFFADGGFFTPDRRARLVSVRQSAPRKLERRYPFVLNTGRIRDQWHTMTRTGKSERLSAHIAEPYAELHPDDAGLLGIAAADLVTVESPHGKVLVRALVTERAAQGNIFVPMHWTDQVSSKARVDAVVAPDTDPVSGQPGLKFTPVAVTRAEMQHYGFAVLREKPVDLDLTYWALAPIREGWRLEFACDGASTPCDPALRDLALRLLGQDSGGEDLISVEDRHAGSGRYASWTGDRLDGAVFVSREPVAVSRQWACGLLAQPAQSLTDRLGLLAGRSAAGRPDPGPIVCSCFQIGAKDIARAATQGHVTLEAIGQTLRAGTNCGSCRSEISSLLNALQDQQGDRHDIAQAG
ncbi:nitrate reductase [Roseibium aestuarii]|uniref:Molybdopterin-dependent oxidoreductase n=1 Tax=Roseibium aestuarii TaxID=2600299 RepID=A0ABW4JTX8_9HYPH|nr:nitrate reductase [Roseibium aestuarii]